MRHEFDFEAKRAYNTSMSHPEQAPSPLKILFEQRNLPDSQTDYSLHLTYIDAIHNNFSDIRMKLERLPNGSYSQYELHTGTVQGATDSLEDHYSLGVNLSASMGTLKPIDVPGSSSNWKTHITSPCSGNVSIHMRRNIDHVPEFKTYLIRHDLFTFIKDEEIIPMETSHYTDLIYLTRTIANDL